MNNNINKPNTNTTLTPICACLLSFIPKSNAPQEQKVSSEDWMKKILSSEDRRGHFGNE